MFQIAGEFEVRPDLGCVRRVGSTSEIPLRPKTFQTLLYLIQNRERLVTKDELSAHLWSDTAVTDDALVQCIVELRKALGDSAREPRFVRTVPKLGYRFVAPVSEASPTTSSPVVGDLSGVTSAKRTAVESQPLWRHWPIGAGAVAIVAVVAMALWSSGVRTESAALDPATGKPGIAVMFLDNQSHTEATDWMRQGLAEMLITGLSRSDRVNVLGRKHLQTLLDRLNHPADREISLATARDVARRAQASHVLTGSFATLGAKIRIDVRLEGIDGKQVASETLTVDRPEDVLTQVDLLAWKLARRFDAGVARPEAVASAGLTNDLEAYRAYSQGLSKAIAYHGAEAVTLFEYALQRDPRFVMAKARLGYVYAVTWGEDIAKGKGYLEAAFADSDRLRESDRLYIQAWHAMASRDFAAAIEPLQRLIRLYPYELEAYDRLTRLLRGEQRQAEAIEVARRGLLIDPESSDLCNSLGGAYISLGQYADGIAAHQRYVALAPNEPNSHDSLGLSFHAAGRYAEAEQSYQRALDLKPDFDVATAHLANVYFQTGRYEAAERVYLRYASITAAKARAWISIARIRQRRGHLVEARAAAATSDAYGRATPGQPQYAMLMIDALERRPLLNAPDWAPVTMSNRGSRASLRMTWWLAGWEALLKHDAPLALDRFRESLREIPILWDLDPLEDGLAKAYMELGRWDDAIAEYQRLLQANPSYPRAHYHLAIAYARKGDQPAARRALTRFLELWRDADADAPEIVDAQRRLARMGS